MHTRGSQRPLRLPVGRMGLHCRTVTLRPRRRSSEEAGQRPLPAAGGHYVALSRGEKLLSALLWEQKFCLEGSTCSKGASLAIIRPPFPRGKITSAMATASQRLSHGKRSAGFSHGHVLASRDERQGREEERRGWPNHVANFVRLLPRAPCRRPVSPFDRAEPRGQEAMHPVSPSK